MDLTLFNYCPQNKFAKFMFLHLSDSHSVHGGEYLPRYRTGQVHPLDRYIPWVGTPPAGTPPPPGRYTPQQVHHPGRYTPLGRYTPWQVHHPGRYTPLGRYTPQQGHPRQCMLGYGQQVGGMVNKQAVRILLEYILVS